MKCLVTTTIILNFYVITNAQISTAQKIDYNHLFFDKGFEESGGVWQYCAKNTENFAFSNDTIKLYRASVGDRQNGTYNCKTNIINCHFYGKRNLKTYHINQDDETDAIKYTFKVHYNKKINKYVLSIKDPSVSFFYYIDNVYKGNSSENQMITLVKTTGK